MAQHLYNRDEYISRRCLQILQTYTNTGNNFARERNFIGDATFWGKWTDFFFGADALETMRTASPALHYRPEALHPLAGCEINV